MAINLAIPYLEHILHLISFDNYFAFLRGVAAADAIPTPRQNGIYAMTLILTPFT